MKQIMQACLLIFLSHAPLSLQASTAKEFRAALISLHHRLETTQHLRKETRQGQYEGSRAANMRYIDSRYFDESGLLVSHIQKDADAPDNIHIIEVNIIENGRVSRDFGSISLPWAPDLPIRNMINLHLYNDQLHSFRQYNLYGEIDYEACEGKHAGKPVTISLDGSDIKPENTSSELYKACFTGMSTDWKIYTTPH